MSTYLLDTHVVIWLAVEPLRIPDRLRHELERAKGLAVSAASAYEISQKVRLGKLPGAAGIVARWPELIAQMMAEEIPLSTADMARAGGMTWEHRDPFDRMLVAQAQLRGLHLVTQDAVIRSFSEVACADWS